ncbi:hypothetical protein AHMF7616_04105 [Adhaeribacter pallidiroseus]|uniref:Uncharacterized protein n=2 Tax=Adhaeribacter pallidiroseus TaxID=2072847 RepID=A0A369QP71_9BACT|nr:hypothetical protein AHMF7616_04105 [Adhaeribacter pallidiroseus]
MITHIDGEIVGTVEQSTDGKVTVYLLTIYDKSETVSRSAKE